MSKMPKSPAEWFEAMHHEIGDGASDRAVAIVATAMLDDALKFLLEKLLVRPPEGKSLLARNDSPLGSFSARIWAAYQLGLITLKFALDLDRIRKIRNDAAHQSIGFSFEISPTLDHVTSLAKHTVVDTYDWMHASLAKRSFVTVASWMLYELHDELERVSPLIERTRMALGYMQPLSSDERANSAPEAPSGDTECT